jgi:osmotically inducible protein OsmC
MADAPRRADAVWQGSLAQGSGEVSLMTSGAAGPLPVTWASRTERSNGKTSPEELVAAAHASCYNMALSNILAEAGAAAAKDGCPISGALKGNVELSVEATLA